MSPTEPPRQLPDRHQAAAKQPPHVYRCRGRRVDARASDAGVSIDTLPGRPQRESLRTCPEARRSGPPLPRTEKLNVKLPLLQVVLKRPSGQAGPAGGGTWSRIKVNLWGVWCDRADDQIMQGDTLRVSGGMLETDPDAQPGDHSNRLVLPPRGAPNGAAVHVTGRRSPDHIFNANITEERLTANRMPANCADAAGQPVLACRENKKRSRGAERQYSYAPIGWLPAGPGASEVHIFGVVLDYTLPRATRGTDLKSTLELVDESCDDPGKRLVVNFWKAHPEPPGVGAVIRLHRVRPMSDHVCPISQKGVHQAEEMKAGARSMTAWVVGDLSTDGAKSSEDATRGCKYICQYICKFVCKYVGRQGQRGRHAA